jgi:hypothetical protein
MMSRRQRELDAEYEQQEILHRRAGQWPRHGCHYCGSTDTPIDHVYRCTYCAELYSLVGPAHDPRFPPFRMILEWR